MRSMRTAIGLLALALITDSLGIVHAADIHFSRTATPAEMQAIREAAADMLRQAESMPPVTFWAADGLSGKVAVRVEGQAVCGHLLGCPAFVMVGGRVIWRGMLPESAEWP